MDAWVWFVIGLTFLILEVFIPSGCALMVFAMSALTTGLIAISAGIDLLATQLVIFAAFSVAFLVLAIKPLRKFFGADKTIRPPSDVSGESVRIVADIPAGEVGQGEMRGTVWKVVNNSTQLLTTGSFHTVSKVEGLSLIVQ